MDWLLHNSIADMYGPKFLLLYALVNGATLAVAWLAVRRLDWTGRLPFLPVPASPDPYEIAYLRGGETEVAQAVVFALTQRGYLRTREAERGLTVEQADSPPDRGELSQLERRAFDWFSKPRRREELSDAYGLPHEIRGGCQQYEQMLKREHLLFPPEAAEKARLVRRVGTFVIVGLGGYKLLVALLKGHHNVWFLVIMCAVSLLILAGVCRVRTSRLSRRGRMYLDTLQTAFALLKDDRRRAGKAARRDTAQPAQTTQTAEAFGAYDPSLLLLVGAFGLGGLAGTSYESYRKQFAPAYQTNLDGGWGASSASSCGGGSSSCSSSSCGGSSCGGGCGGGGCGGCGGD